VACLAVAMSSTLLYPHKSTQYAGFGTRPLAKQLRSAEFTKTTCRPSLFRSEPRIRAIAHATPSGIDLLLTTDMIAGVAGYRKQSVCCGGSIRCDVKPTHLAIHPMLFCENNRHSLVIFCRRQGTLEPLVCAQRRLACRRSGGSAGCSSAVGAKRIRRCGGH
jgi:hypothetical protein